MGNFFYFVIAIIIIGSLISSVAKSNKAKTKNKNENSTQQTRPSAPPKTGGGLDLASEIKGTSSKPAAKTTFQEEVEKINLQKEKDLKQSRHTHPSAQRNVKVEKAFIESSMGDHHSEGCEEHYYDRFVLIRDEQKNAGVNKELAKIIVMGEVLNNPGYKKYRR